MGEVCGRMEAKQREKGEGNERWKNHPKCYTPSSLDGTSGIATKSLQISVHLGNTQGIYTKVILRINKIYFSRLGNQMSWYQLKVKYSVT